MNKIPDYYEFLLGHTYWYTKEFFRIIGFILTFTMPIILGKFAGEAYKSIVAAKTLSSWSVWKPHWPILAILILWLVGYLINRYSIHIYSKSDELYSSLKWFCEDIGTRSDKRKDIRCTIWIPVGKLSRQSPIRLLQVIHYFPKTSTLFKSNGNNEGIRKNGKRYRTFKVSKKDKSGTLKPVGIIGLTALKCVSGDEPTVERETLSNHKDFKNYMINNWNFSEFQAEHLTSDRKSYLCLPIVNKEKSELLGIVYFDSTHPTVFNDDFVKKTEKYLPRFASIITAL
ncbi:MAG: hypothetical protein HY864_13355 [Chloroflexi bacterium]|nr:hypothetical protein [Chloroflexota bacterium]